MHIHKALLVSTTCQRLGLGFYLFSLIASSFLGMALPMNTIAIIALVLLGIGGLASAFHLGRPGRFFNAFSNFSSHLTQEAAITPFLGIALLLSGANGYFLEIGSFIYWIAAVLAVMFLVSTGLVYQLTARPAWNTKMVLGIFLLTAAQIGAISTMAAGFLFLGSVSMGLVVLTAIMIILCALIQFKFINRLKTVGYGVDINIQDDAYKSEYNVWLFIGTIALAICTLIAGFAGIGILAFAGVICSLIGIAEWTILFYKVAHKVKMFPMYKVDLNINM